MKKFVVLLLILTSIVMTGCNNQDKKDREAVNKQQAQYSKRQPIPNFDWSLERHLVSELYKIRNQKVATHAVWRSDYGIVEGDCPCLGYGLPYDTSLTNPLKKVWSYDAVVEQAEPTGIFASKNTTATWVMCIGLSGQIEPVYVESKVTIYPGSVLVDYDKNRVTRSGAATVMIKK